MGTMSTTCTHLRYASRDEQPDGMESVFLHPSDEPSPCPARHPLKLALSVQNRYTESWALAIEQ
ncbi:MAG TPA: hypothetical protein VK851_04220 [Anaerolineales bacterium]|nr:hypothetical protein [Anaerolineales bacterium]